VSHLLTPTEAAALVGVVDGTCTTDGIADLLGVQRAAARRTLRRLADRGLVAQHGTVAREGSGRPHARWRPTTPSVRRLAALYRRADWLALSVGQQMEVADAG